MTDQPARHSADTITDNDLDELYARLDRVSAELDRIAALPTVDRDERRTDTFSTGANWAIRRVRAALADPKEQQ